jgi:hypothetical protein
MLSKVTEFVIENIAKIIVNCGFWETGLERWSKR